MKYHSVGYFTIALSALCWMNEVCAQSTTDSSAVRNYRFGIQTASNRYLIVYPDLVVNTVKLQPFLVSVGADITSRFELQAGYSYWRERNQPSTSTGTTDTGVPTSSYSESRRTAHAFPVLARYRLTRQAKRRVYVDLLIGPSLVKSYYKLKSEERVDDIVVQSGYDSGQAFNAFGTVGLGARVRFGKHWIAVWDLTANRNFKLVSEYLNREATGNKWGVTRAGNLGFHYRFGLR